MQTISFFKTKASAESFNGGCTQTSKMPCKSYSLPTANCKVGAQLATVKGSICSTCYANKGNYVRYAKNIKPAQERRLTSITSDQWVESMIKSIGKDSFFRWHDSGDIQSIDHLEKIAKVAQSLPGCQFWLPTREFKIVKQFMRKQSVPANLTIRLSAYFPDKSIKPFNGPPISSVHKKSPAKGYTCPAPSQNGECKECRACWNKDVQVVTYKYH